MTTKQQPATPLPWMAVREGVDRRPFLRKAAGQYVAITNNRGGWRWHDIAYAAHAANAYPQLVEALHEACARLDSADRGCADFRSLLRSLGEL